MVKGFDAVPEGTGLVLSDYDFDLPESLIAQRPSQKREEARLLIVRRHPEKGCPQFEDSNIAELPEIARENGLVDQVLWLRNKSRVFPARFYARRPSGGEHEIVLIEPCGPKSRWSAIVRRQARLKYPQELVVKGAESISVILHEGPLVEFPNMNQEEVFALLDRVGEMPLPPYIRERRAEQDKERYQAVWADKSFTGSAAAPTASLHFSQSLLEGLEACGVRFGDVVLHVGLGTFEPLRDESLHANRLHREAFFVPEATLNAIRSSQKRLCLGTTALRTLESVMAQSLDPDLIHRVLRGDGGMEGYTRLFIKPGYEFLAADFLLTNFHLPRSSLFVLVAAFAGSLSLAQEAYRHAIAKQYRFFSYGDATLWL